MKRIIILQIVLGAADAWADTPLRSLVYYSAEARLAEPGFVADGDRGRLFALRDWGVSASSSSCASCHTDQAQRIGHHPVTGGPIPALAPRISPKRFSNPALVEKRFGLDCNQVLGRPCTAAEKADFIKFVLMD